jgi:hypothetical protein
MTPAETARVLAKSAAYDNRTVGEVDVHAWHEVLEDVDYADALAAVTAHYRSSAAWIMPSHVRELAKAAKRDRLRRDGVKAAALALPSRYETDAQRDARKSARMAEVRAQIRRSPRAITSGVNGPSAMDRLRELTVGPVWPDPEVA